MEEAVGQDAARIFWLEARVWIVVFRRGFGVTLRREGGLAKLSLAPKVLKCGHFHRSRAL